jgi:hypothetical protein
MKAIQILLDYAFQHKVESLRGGRFGEEHEKMFRNWYTRFLRVLVKQLQHRHADNNHVMSLLSVVNTLPAVKKSQTPVFEASNLKSHTVTKTGFQ